MTIDMMTDLETAHTGARMQDDCRVIGLHVTAPGVVRGLTGGGGKSLGCDRL